MGAVVALIVIVVGHIVVGIHIVDGEGNLLINIVGALCGAGQMLHKFVDIQILQNRVNVCLGQQIQRCDVFIHGHTLFLSIALQSVQVCAVVEALMVGVQTGVDDGDPGACTGITGSPGIVGSDHGGGSRHHGVCFCSGALKRLILVLQEHILDTTDGGNILHLTKLNVGRNDIGSQGHVPYHIQLLTGQNILLDPCDHSSLLSLKAVAVGHCSGIGCHIRSAVQFQRCFLIQHNGNTNHIGRLIRNFFLRLGHLCGIVHNISIHAIHLGEGQTDTAVIVCTGSRSGSQCPNGTRADDNHQCQDRG